MGYIPGADSADVPSKSARLRKQQVPYGNDNKKSKNNNEAVPSKPMYQMHIYAV